VKEELSSPDPGNPKIYTEISKKYEGEFSEIKENLNSIAESRNLLEPFERLKVACEQVHLQKTGE
jgi:ABC-type Zn uptake system ZnuABC Zn-binding protein ZnuA